MLQNATNQHYKRNLLGEPHTAVPQPPETIEADTLPKSHPEHPKQVSIPLKNPPSPAPLPVVTAGPVPGRGCSVGYVGPYGLLGGCTCAELLKQRNQTAA